MAERLRICHTDDIMNMYETASNLIWVHYHSTSYHEGIFQIDYYTELKTNGSVECGGQLNGTKL